MMDASENVELWRLPLLPVDAQSSITNWACQVCAGTDNIAERCRHCGRVNFQYFAQLQREEAAQRLRNAVYDGEEYQGHSKLEDVDDHSPKDDLPVCETCSQTLNPQGLCDQCILANDDYKKRIEEKKLKSNQPKKPKEKPGKVTGTCLLVAAAVVVLGIMLIWLVPIGNLNSQKSEAG